MKRMIIRILMVLSMIAVVVPVSASTKVVYLGVNVVLTQDLTKEMEVELKKYGVLLNRFEKIDAITMRVKSNQIESIKALPYVLDVTEDAERVGAPIDRVMVEDFTLGLNTWNLDMVNVTDLGQGRVVDYDGEGVYVAVLDTGLHDSWRSYFPQERIMSHLAISYSGGGGEVGRVSSQKNKWEHDTNGHGTHVTSTILGFNLFGNSINGVAPKVNIIPVKVLNQNGRGWSSVITQGILYVAYLKETVLKDVPVVINMSLGGSVLDAMEKTAIDYAIEVGVIIVASAGNNGQQGMGYPGAYEPVISVGSVGTMNEFSVQSWWYAYDVSEINVLDELYVSSFSSRKTKDEHDLDVVAPGSYVVGPYQVNQGQLSYYYLSGTSMAAPHVTGIVALMLQKDPMLSALEVESLLEYAALPIENAYDLNGNLLWDKKATGAGLITADAVLDLIP